MKDPITLKKSKIDTTLEEVTKNFKEINRFKILFTATDSDAKNPTKSTEYSAGWDIYTTEGKCIQPHSIEIFRTGLKIKEIPVNVEIQIRSRSGLSIKNGICVINSPGTIDPDYEGEILVALINHSNSPYSVSKHDRIAQMVLGISLIQAELEVLGIPKEEIEVKKRNDGKFGSTGK